MNLVSDFNFHEKKFQRTMINGTNIVYCDLLSYAIMLDC